MLPARRALLRTALCGACGAALARLPVPARAAPGAAATLAGAPGAGAPDLPPADTLPYPARDDVQAFLAEAAEAHGIDPVEAARTLALARYSPDAHRLTTPGGLPPSSRNWRTYRAAHVDERRIRAGLAFLADHPGTLARARDAYGVPPAVVAAIIGIESLYGRVMGRHRTLDVLATLSFDYTRRAALYRAELVQFLLLCRERAIAPTDLLGSFAGAVGLPQFMPSAIRAHAVDFDGDGLIDLVASMPDAIGSVARYLQRHGWVPDAPLSLPARVADPAAVPALAVGITARWSWGELAGRGVSVDAELPDALPVLLVDLPWQLPDGTAGVELRVGTANLAAILHYNRSYMYACAVADFAATLARRGGPALL